MIASTKLLVRDIVDGFELDPDVVRRIPGGINPDWWRTVGSDEVRAAARSGLVLAWGRVQYEKGFQVLARAMSSLRYRVAGIECMIAGRGSYSCGSEFGCRSHRSGGNNSCLTSL